MKHLLIIMAALLMVACTGKQKAGTTYDRYVDSIKTAYPNYSENISVQKKIDAEFAKQLTSLPGVLEGAVFYIVGIHEIGGKTSIMLAIENEGKINDKDKAKDRMSSVDIWDNDYPADEASKLDKDKHYKVTGGTPVSFEPVHGIADPWLDFGSVTVKDLQLEELPE